VLLILIDSEIFSILFTNCPVHGYNQAKLLADTKADVVVIGGGVGDTAAAIESARMGVKQFASVKSIANLNHIGRVGDLKTLILKDILPAKNFLL
jgi:hypothetical protein